MPFTHLHTHSEGSLLDSIARVSDAFHTVLDDGQTAMAITDHGNLNMVWRAKKAAAELGMTFAPGNEVYLALNSDGTIGDRRNPGHITVTSDLTDDSGDKGEDVEYELDGDGKPLRDENGHPKVVSRKKREKRKHYYHLTLIAYNRAGWHNLVRINNESTRTLLNGKYPGCDLELLGEHSEGIIAMTGCLGGPVLGPMSQGRADLAVTNLDALRGVFGDENLFVEVMEHGIPEESSALPALKALADDTGLRVVATNDAHYTSHDHAHAHDAWLALRTDDTLDNPSRYRFHGEGYHLRTEAEMRALRDEPWWQEACDNTQVIASRFQPDIIPDGHPMLPKFPTPEGFDSNRKYLAHLINEGATRIYGPDRPAEVSERLNTEWKVITDMGFDDYFLIDWDMVHWAKTNGILVGPGRGSAAGSLIAYCLGITGIDPLEHDLLFERFLEPGRTDFPDIDIDFERSRRDDVLDYLESRWGEGHVALIGSFGVSKTRASVKNAAKVLDLGKVGATLTKLIPVIEGNPMSFDDLLDEDNAQSAEFRRVLGRFGDDGQRVLDLARTFDNVTRGATIHACGVVISDQYLPDLIPVRYHKTTGRLITLWDSKDIEAFGLIKFDVLSLRNLDIAKTAMEYIEEITGEKLSIETIPHPDTKGDPRVDAAWKLLREGRTAGIFQMEGAAMTALTQDVQPSAVDHLSAVLALFRPGPISAQMPERYALRKNGKERVDYGIYTSDKREQEAIATRLGATYGILCFQEQLMLLGTTIAGFDAGMRSKLRKAIGKKNRDLMAQVKVAFLDGAGKEFRDDAGTVVSPVFRKDTAERVWAMFEGAASYAFNASHSFAYAYLAFWTAYLKANWPGSYGAAILANTDDKDKRYEALIALPAEGIEILAPDINSSRAVSAPEGRERVRLGLGEIAAVGSAGDAVVRARGTAPYASLGDLVNRARLSEDSNKPLPANQIIGLIEAGALDQFGPRLGLTMIARIAGAMEKCTPPAVKWGVIERSSRQRQRLGVALGENPLVTFRGEINAWRKKIVVGRETIEEKAIPVSKIPSEAGATVTVIGLLARWSEGSYRGGRKAAMVLEGSADRIEGIMWDRELSAQKESEAGVPVIGMPVAVTARVTVREFEQEDEFGNVTITSVRQLTVSRIDPVEIEDPVTSGAADDVEVPTFRIVGADEAARDEQSAPVGDEMTEDELIEDDVPVEGFGAVEVDVSFDEPAETVTAGDAQPEDARESEPTGAARQVGAGEKTLTLAPYATWYRMTRQLPESLRNATWEPHYRGRPGTFMLTDINGKLLARVIVE